MKFTKEKVGEGKCKHCKIPFTCYKITINANVVHEYLVAIVIKDGREGQHVYSPFWKKCTTIFNDFHKQCVTISKEE